MADEALLQRVHDLSDLELALLLCLISREHCLISTPVQAIDQLILELQLIAARTFGLAWTSIECSPSSTLQDFASGLLTPGRTHELPARSSSTPRLNHRNFESTTPTPTAHSRASDVDSVKPQITNVVLVKNLHLAPQSVQIQALELLRTRRIFTRTAVEVAPKQFVFIPVVEAESGGEAHVTPHLNDFLSIAHWHDPDDGYLNLEELDGDDALNAALISGPMKQAISTLDNRSRARILEDDITYLREQAQKVKVEIDVTRYQMNIVSFLRMHRAVAQGITPAATRHFDRLIRNLAPLHKLNYVTPALVCLAARKIYLHRIQIVQPEKERSMQWGSSLAAVQALLDGVGPEEVIEQVLEMVTAPV